MARADLIDAWDGLQQRQGVALVGQFLQQAGIKADDARFDILDMADQFIKHEAVAVSWFTVQRIEDFLTAGFEPTAGKSDHLVRRLPGDDGNLPEGGKPPTACLACTL